MRRLTRLVVGAAAISALAGWGNLRAEPLDVSLQRLVEDGGVAVGLAEGKAYAFRPGSYVPASIIKLATALAAFHYLGPDFRFRTEVYRDSSGNLILRGHGDPFLISEEWAEIAVALAGRGVFARPLGDLVLDDSAFAGAAGVDGSGDSLNPYDARLGALVSNFNTIFVDVDGKGAVRSAEPQTPLTPLAGKLALALPPGRHRINFSQRDGDSLRYTGELARTLFERAGARFQGRIVPGSAPAGLKPVLVHLSSRPLSERVEAMMEFSNNFIANQIVLGMALEKGGEPASLEQGMALLRRFLREQLGIAPNAVHLVESSGISRKNRMELNAMLGVVAAFRPWRGLLRPYGRGPLRGVAKTGTLTGVYSLAGFLPGPPGRERPFVIMLNQERNTRGSIYRRIARRFGSSATGDPR
jgi:D-alanyl-D-alanine carboxypeptidase/D-alanyl-D-alanine-endopeptidase (penicillin-binding protein 4)